MIHRDPKEGQMEMEKALEAGRKFRDFAEKTRSKTSPTTPEEKEEFIRLLNKFFECLAAVPEGERPRILQILHSEEESRRAS